MIYFIISTILVVLIWGAVWTVLSEFSKLEKRVAELETWANNLASVMASIDDDFDDEKDSPSEPELSGG